MPNRTSSLQLDAQILKAVDKGLEILGGEPVQRAFYYHVEKRAKIKREEIPCNLDAFHKALAALFFQGSAIIEKRIARNLYETLGLEFEERAKWNLTDYVKHAKLLNSQS